MTHSKSWNSKNLTQFGRILSAGYDPGLGADAPANQTWTAKTQCRTAQMLGRGYNPGM